MRSPETPEPLDDALLEGYAENQRSVEPDQTGADGRPPMAQTQAERDVAQALAARWPGVGRDPDPASASVAELLACLPTAVCLEHERVALRAVAQAQRGTPLWAVLERDAIRWARTRQRAERRDRLVAARRRQVHPECICLGQGGLGELVAVVLSPSGVPQVVEDAEGRQVTTWEQRCPCPDGQGHLLELARARRDAAERYRARRVAARAGRAEIPRLYRGLTVESWATRARTALAQAGEDPGRVEQIRATIELWRRAVIGPDPSERSILLLGGNNGTGKTGLAAALGQRWLASERSVLFRTVARLASELRAAPYRTQGADDPRTTEAELLVAYVEADLLVLDDLGTEALLGAEADRLRERLFFIIDERLTACRPTVVTLTLTRAMVGERLGASLADRLHGNASSVRIWLDTPNLRADESPEAGPLLE